MKQEYGWDYSLDDDFNYQGGIKAVISSMFDERRRESEQNPVRNPYGVGANKQVITTVSSVTQLKWDVFDESILSEFMAKLMAIFGCYFGFRGRKEHALMTVNNLTHGKFEEGHPFAGHMYYGVQNLFDKSTKLTLNNQYARVDENRQRIPVIDVNDQNDPGGTIHRYLELISPGQQRLYCYEATKEERAKWQHVYPNARFSPNKPLGENAVAVKMKVASKKLGLGELGGHAFRRLCGTTLNNAEGVSVEEALGTMRHNSVSATRAYIVRDNVSEAKKFKAYGLEPKKKNN